MNWFCRFKLEEWCNDQTKKDPDDWQCVCEAVRKLTEYTIVALNSKVDDSDIGLYFRRMNKSGIVPTQEEIEYSMLKAKIEEAKDLDKCECRRTSSHRMAQVAMRLFLSLGNEKMQPVDIDRILKDKDSFGAFVKKGGNFQELVKQLDDILIGDDKDKNGLLPLHIQQIYNAGDGELATLLLKYCYVGCAEKMHLRALSTILMWFAPNLAQAVGIIWENNSMQEGLSLAMRQGALLRINTPDEVEKFVEDIIKVLEAKDTEESWDSVWSCRWHNPDFPDMPDFLNCLWTGFHDGKGCPLLLYACRGFIKKWFNGYDSCSPEWNEQSRPWDYDHIAPQDWFKGNKTKKDWRLPLCRDALNSIGNSAPIPFSINRRKRADRPGKNYPYDGDVETPDSREDFNLLHLEKDVEEYDEKIEKIHRDCKASKLFIRITYRRTHKLYRDWYDTCMVKDLLAYRQEVDDRRKGLEEFKRILEGSLGNVEVEVYFVKGERQYLIKDDSWDWEHPNLACGIKGTISVGGREVRCLLGVAVGSKGDEWKCGMRRHPEDDGSIVPNWYVCDENGNLIFTQERLKFREFFQSWAEKYKFKPE